MLTELPLDQHAGEFACRLSSAIEASFCVDAVEELLKNTVARKSSIPIRAAS
jgi:hypothetical protein